MGGFTLIGPSYVFQNLPQHQQEQCRCLGFNGEISRQVEDILLNNRDQTLRLEDLPDDEYELLERLENTHLGTEMRYSIQKRAIPGKPLLQTRPVRIADVWLGLSFLSINSLLWMMTIAMYQLIVINKIQAQKFEAFPVLLTPHVAFFQLKERVFTTQTLCNCAIFDSRPILPSHRRDCLNPVNHSFTQY